jgi:hypothetical protein
MINEILENLKKINQEEYDDEAKAQFQEWEGEVKKVEMLKGLLQHDYIKQLVEEAKRIITNCDKELSNNRKISDFDRQVLFNKKDLYEWFLNKFSLPDLEQLNKKISDYAK